MADFLPIGLGRDGAGNVSHFQEITSSDSIPENYLQVSNTSPKWNASALQSIPVCTNTPAEGQALVYSSSLGVWCASTVTAAAVITGQADASSINTYPICATPPNTGDSLVWNGSEWCPSTLIDNTGVTGVGVTDRIVKWTDSTSIGDAGFGVTLPLTDGRILEFDLATTALIDSGYGREDAGWNANKIQGVSASPTAPTDGQVWVYASANNRWTPSTLVLTGGGGAGTIDGNGTAGRLAVWTGLSTLANWNPSISDGQILEWDSGVSAPISTGYTRTEAAWNAGELQGYAIPTPTLGDDGQLIILSPDGTLQWKAYNGVIDFTGPTGNLESVDPLSQRLNFVFFNQTGSGTSGTFQSVSATSGMPDGTFFVASGGGIVPAYLPAYMLRYFGSVSSYPSQAEPAESLNAEGQLLYYDATNQRWTNTLNLKVDTGSNLSVANVSSTGTIRAVTLSSTNYLNLPSSTIVWASAGYATLAGSATSALNAQQAPNGFNVTGSMLATTVSATNYRNIRPYVSSVDSATTTTVNIGGDFDTYLVNTTTTSVTLYLPDASAWTSKQITISKVEDGGSYRSVTLSGAQLQTATNTIRLYDPTESVTVISNGTNWYSMDYDRAYGVVVVCKNSTGATLTKGTPVRVTSATGDNVLIATVSSVSNHVPEAPANLLRKCIGLVEHDIPNGEFGHVLTKGTLYKFNTNAFNDGDVLYLASGGGLTNVSPPPPYDEVVIGIVTRKQSVNGSILVDIQNEVSINNIVGMNLTSSLVNGDLISYSTTTSTFTNVQTVNVSGQGNFGSVSATNISGTTITATNLSATTISTPKYPTYIYTATGISVGTNKLMFDMFNGAGSGKTLKVTRIVAYVRNTTTITGINQVLECYRTSSVGTGGTTVTESKMVTSDPALNVNITARNTPTGGASYYNSSGVLAAANIYTEEGQNLQERVYLYMYDSFAGLEECLTVREGEGLRINTGAVGTAGVIAIYVYFITV